MHDLPALIIRAKQSTESRKQLEQAIEELIHDINNYNTLEHLLNSGEECQLYCSIVIERRLKFLLKTQYEDQSIDQLVNFMNSMFSQCMNFGVLNKLSDTYALSILYFYPKHNATFFQMITNAVESKSLVGFLVLREYLFMLNVSTEITPARRTELKNAGKRSIFQIIEFLLTRYGGNNSEYEDGNLTSIIIEIFTHSLPHYKEIVDLLNFTCLAGLQTNVTLDFFNHFLTLNTKSADNIDKILTFAQNSDISFAYDILIILSHCKIDFKSMKLLDIIVCLLDSGYFIISIIFLSKIYKKDKINEQYTLLFLNKIAIESHKIYSVDGDLSSWVDYDPEEYTIQCIKLRIEEIVRHASSKTPSAVKILQSGIFPNKLAVILLNQYPHASVFLPFYLCYQSYVLHIQPDINILDYSDPESCKLAYLSISKYNYSTDLLLNIIDRTRRFNFPEADDLIVSASIKFSNMTGADCIPMIITGFDDNSLRRLVIFVKKNFKGVQSIIPNFIAMFEESMDVKFLPLIGICLKMKISTGNALQIIYNNTKIWHYDNLKGVVNDILNYTDEPVTQAFTELLLCRMRSEQETGVLGRCFLNVIERKIAACINSEVLFSEGSGIYFYCNLLVDLLDIHDTFLIRRIFYIVSHFNLELNYPLTVYKLLILYNADDIPDAQSEILRFLSEILPKMNDLSVLAQVNKSPEEIQNLKDSLTTNKKTNVQLLKEFLKNIKGANFRVDAVMVGSQFNKPSKDESKSVDLSDFFKNN